MNTLDKIKQDTKAYIETIEIDVSTLDSYKYTPARFDDVYGSDPAEESYCENEEWEAQIAEFLKYMETDELGEYIDLADGEEEYKAQIVAWLEGLL